MAPYNNFALLLAHNHVYRRASNFILLILRYLIRFFRLFQLPLLAITLDRSKLIPKSFFVIFLDLLYINFVLKYFPSNYMPCRLWEQPRSKWALYYGSNYEPNQRYKLQLNIQAHQYKILFDNKFIAHALCKGLGLPVPRLFAVLHRNNLKLITINGILDENNVTKCILKPISGHRGKGVLLYKRSDFVMIDYNHDALLSTFYPIEKHDYIVQEYIIQHETLSTFCSSSLNTVRIITFLQNNFSVCILACYIRFGRQGSIIDNVSQGGLRVAVDTNTGKLTKFGSDLKGNQFTSHPDTHVTFLDAVIPFWNETVSYVSFFQHQFPQYRLLGFDIGITSSGPVIVEINSEPDLLGSEVAHGPLFNRTEILHQFGFYHLLINSRQIQMFSKTCL